MAQIAKNIKKQRVSSGMTQEELAKRLYVTRQTISNYENGKSNPVIETLRQMAQVLDTDMELFLYGEQKPKDKKEIIKTAVILGAILLFTLITPVIVKNERKINYNDPEVERAFFYFMHLVGTPVLLVLAGIFITKLIVLITSGTPPRFPIRKIAHRVVLFSSIAYFLLMLPRAIIPIISNVLYYIWKVEYYSFERCCYRILILRILDEIGLRTICLLYDYPVVYAVFFIIGCLLYLTASRKATPKDKTPAKIRSENKTPAC